MSVIIEVTPTALLVENTLFTLSAALYVLAAVFHVLLLSGKKKAGLIADLIFKTGFLLHTAFIVTRGINVRRVPFVGHYEFGNLFIWATVLLYFLLKWRRRGKFNIVGAFLTLIVVLYLSYLIVIPVLFPSINIDRMHRALKPVLRSSWLKIHVSASAFGYAGFTLAFTAAVMWLLRSRLPEKKYPARIMPDCSTVEEFMYSAAVIGFLFQSIMIITGAVWADISWGRYWGWDPKEVWALITWFVYAVYLHARLTRGWTGGRAVALVLIGWLAMLFTWTGVAWWLTGIHSFG